MPPIRSLACRCAEAARTRKFKVFGLQNFGECWSGPGAENEFARDGPSDKCYQVLKVSPPPCNKTDPRECTGAAKTNYVYNLDPKGNNLTIMAAPMTSYLQETL